MDRIKACKDLTHRLSIKPSKNNVFLELLISQVEVEVDLDLHHQLNQENKESLDKLFLQHLVLQLLSLLMYPYQRGYPQPQETLQMSLLHKLSKNKKVFQGQINLSQQELNNLRALKKQIYLLILRFWNLMFLFQEEFLEKQLSTERRRNMHHLELKIYLCMK